VGHLILQGDDTVYPGFSLLGESSLAITLDENRGRELQHTPVPGLERDDIREYRQYRQYRAHQRL